MKKYYISLSFLLLLFLFSFKLYAISDYENLIKVRIYHEKDERYISYIKSELAKEIVKFQMKVRAFPDIETIINIASDNDMYNSWIESKGRIFESSQAFCDLKSNEIFIRNPSVIRDNRKLITIILHEYIHLFVNYHWTDAPLWFHEGMAVYFSEGLSINKTFHFISNYAFHKTYLLKKYAYKYPDNPADYYPYYFQSAFVVKKMIDDYPNKFTDLFDYSGFNTKFNDAFQKAFLKTHEDFLSENEKRISRFFYFNIYFGVLSLMWIMFPVFLIIANVKKSIKNKKIIETWSLEILKEEIEEEILKKQWRENEKEDN